MKLLPYKLPSHEVYVSLTTISGIVKGRVAQYWNTVLRLLPTKTLRLLLILHRVFNWCLVSSTCVL